MVTTRQYPPNNHGRTSTTGNDLCQILHTGLAHDTAGERAAGCPSVRKGTLTDLRFKKRSRPAEARVTAPHCNAESQRAGKQPWPGDDGKTRRRDVKRTTAPKLPDGRHGQGDYPDGSEEQHSP